MDVLLITDVPAGITAVTATINSDSGLVWLPGTSSLGVYTTAAAANITLTETVAGSGRFTAPRPALPVGGYTVIYRADGEVVGHERVTVGNSTVTIVVEPLTVDPIGPKITGNDIEVYTSTAEVLLFSGLLDRNGVAPNLAGKTLQFVVESNCRNPVRLFQTTATQSNGTVTVQLTTEQTAKPFSGVYALRDITSGVVLATGDFCVISAPEGD